MRILRYSKEIVSLFMLVVFAFSALACAGSEPAASYDGKVFDISNRSDQSLTLTSKKIGNDYELTVSGTGEALDYENKSLVPWNVLAKKVSAITIEEGVQSIGNYYFYSTTVKQAFLPESVKKIGEFSFAPDTVLYSFSDKEIKTGNTIYYYSESAPIVKNKYFYMEDGEPIIWQVLDEPVSVLFIGNSFTFRQGTQENPMIPYLFKKIAENLGAKVNVDAVVESSYTLAKYANDHDALGSVVAQKLRSNQYDYIVLQEQSTTPLNSYDSFNAAVKSLAAKIDQTQEHATVYLYQTWGSPAGIGSAYKTVADMTRALDAAYSACAGENELRVTHVGNAITAVFDNHKNIAVFADDNRHQSNIGAYLSACCHVWSMLGLDVRKCTYYGDDGIIGESTARILQETAVKNAK